MPSTNHNGELEGVDGLEEGPGMLVVARRLEHFFGNIVQLIGVPRGLVRRWLHPRLHDAVHWLLDEAFRSS